MSRPAIGAGCKQTLKPQNKMELNLFTQPQPTTTQAPEAQTSEGMNATNFIKLASIITGRDLHISTQTEILPETEYFIYKVLPLTQRKIGFIYKAPKDPDNFLRSFITQFTTKFKEPNPRAYDYSARTYGEKARWENKSDLEKEYAHSHHSSNMYDKKELMEQIEANFSRPEITTGLIRYGFYPTLYGIGIFCFWYTAGVEKAIQEMRDFLATKGIPFKTEFSEARWVFRFKLGLSKQAHLNLITEISK